MEWFCPRSGKIPYATKADAQAAADGLMRRDGNRPDVYQCFFCRFWHLATPLNQKGTPHAEVRKRKRQRRKAREVKAMNRFKRRNP